MNEVHLRGEGYQPTFNPKRICPACKQEIAEWMNYKLDEICCPECEEIL